MKHKHHIIPKHAGGTDDPSNLIELTVEEHAEAHRILWEQYGKKEDELAWKGLAGLIGKEELVRQLCVLSGQKGMKTLRERHPELVSRKGLKHSNETKKKLSDMRKGVKKSNEHRNNISLSKSKDWLIKTPSGDTIKVKNLEKYCNENNLSGSKMSLVASGIRRHHKGYTCERLKV